MTSNVKGHDGTLAQLRIASQPRSSHVPVIHEEGNLQSPKKKKKKVQNRLFAFAPPADFGNWSIHT